MIFGLIVIIVLVLILPFIHKKVEHNLEVFLFVMGLAATLVSGVWIISSGPHAGQFNAELLKKALTSPLMITLAVLVAGMLFKILQHRIKSAVDSILKVIPIKFFILIVVIVLGLVSSIITAIIAALILIEVVTALSLERKQEISLIIIACFSIGLGAALTPIGEPLSTIAVSRLGQDFTYLLRLLGIYIVPGVIALSLLAFFMIKPKISDESLAADKKTESYAEVIIRALKVYLFVVALELLGEGFKPVIDAYILNLNQNVLYWLNMISAVLDNATLTAAEISLRMDHNQVRFILVGLLISGGMLIPGNIPNIISAGKLKIGSKEWAKIGLPLGLVMMVIYFVILNI